jgi:CHAT domain-containing protein/tetratricopeptide (TPR) repeat protein
VAAAFAALEINEGDDAEAALRALLERAESDPEARAALEALQRQAMEANPMMQAVQALLEADSPAQVIAAAQAHPGLLSDEADAMIRQGIENARQQGDEGMARHIEQRYATLRDLRQQTRAQSVTPEQVTESDAAQASPLLQTLQAFISARTWADSMRVVQAHPALLEDEAETLLNNLIADAQDRGDDNAVEVFTEHRELLRRCRETSVQAAFAEKMGLPPDADPLEAAAAAQAQAAVQAALPEDLRRALAELVEQEGITSQEELETALEARPELREALARAVQQAGAGQSGGGSGGSPLDIPPEFMADVRELRGVLARLQREPHLAPQRVAILARMLARSEITRHPEFRAAVLNDLGNVYLNLPMGDRAENLERAIHHYTQALKEYTTDVWPERARDVRRRLGAAYFTARDWTAAHEAFAKARELTNQFYTDALLAEVREQEAGANAQMVAQDTFCLAQLGDGSGAWIALEAGRARALREGLDRTRARQALADRPKLRARHRQLVEREQALREVIRLPEDDERHRPYHEVRNELAEIVAARRALQAQVLTEAGIMTGDDGSQDLQATIEAEIGRLPLLQTDGTGVLALAVTEHGTLAMLLTRGGVEHRVVETLTREDVETLIYQRPDADTDEKAGGWLGAYLPMYRTRRELRNATLWAHLMPQSETHRRDFEQAQRDHDAAVVRWRTTLTATLEILGQRLWSALDGLLQEAGVQCVTLIPQGQLFLLPLHACPLEIEGKTVYAGERYPMGYAPAASLLVSPNGVDDVVPDVGTARSPLLVTNPTRDLRRTVAVTPAVRAVLGGNAAASSVVSLWEADATQSNVVQAMADADVVYFYGHGTYNWAEPERSGLVLADAQDPDGHDLLTVAEMRDRLRLKRVRLMTLAACESGMVEVQRGLADEYIGLPGILLQAGTRAVVASLWTVSAFATALLMWRFYEAWDRGAVPIAEALAQAQRWLRTRTRAQVHDALDELNQSWAAIAHESKDPAMQRRARAQFWIIREAQDELATMDDVPFAHPYWWAAFQAVGDVL